MFGRLGLPHRDSSQQISVNQPPFPGTPLYQKLECEQRLCTKDWAQYNLKTPVFKPKQMTTSELTQGMKTMYTEFYSLTYTIQRVVQSLRLGYAPFFSVLARNVVATMNARKLFTKH